MLLIIFYYRILNHNYLLHFTVRMLPPSNLHLELPSAEQNYLQVKTHPDTLQDSCTKKGLTSYIFTTSL